MKNGIWHPADFDGKNAGEEKTKEKTAVAIAYEPRLLADQFGDECV